LLEFGLQATDLRTTLRNTRHSLRLVVMTNNRQISAVKTRKRGPVRACNCL
jgi:hypothetical protein